MRAGTFGVFLVDISYRLFPVALVLVKRLSFVDPDLMRAIANAFMPVRRHFLPPSSQRRAITDLRKPPAAHGASV
jgi:hypothetical protein